MSCMGKHVLMQLSVPLCFDLETPCGNVHVSMNQCQDPATQFCQFHYADS